MKIGISTWSLLHNDLGSAIRTIGEAGFEYIELWGEVPHAHPDWTDKNGLKDSLSPYDMTLTLHAPFTDLNPASLFEPVRGAIERALVDFLSFGEDLGASMITLHPGGSHNVAMVPRSAESAVALIRSLAKKAEGKISLSIENQTSSRSHYSFPLGSTAESMDKLLTEVEGARFTLDTGHAHASGIDPLSLCERFAGKLAEVHLSDNEGHSDDHMIPGLGTAKLDRVIEKLSGTDVLLCLEIDPYRYSPEEVVKAGLSIKEA